ncbi:MAG TPA: IS110 family transposase [Gaiellaceae bacterium]
MEWTVAVGVDTHKDAHVAVALNRLGARLGSCRVPSNERGYRALLEWARSLATTVAFAVEGSGSYGAGLARFLVAAGELVFESERPRRRDRRSAKSDLIDATLAARRLFSGDGLNQLRGAGRREELRLLLLERRSASQARTAALNQLHAVLLVAPEALRGRLSALAAGSLARACSRLRNLEDKPLTAVLRRIARRVLMLDQELALIDDELKRLVSELFPELLDECGVGVVCAAQLLVSSGDPKRMRSEAAFAALAGTNPVDASSGRQQRHRLNRGGDRQLNRALHVIALARIRHHPETASYYKKLLATGKTAREARRCIKRALARHFYRRLTLTQPT